MKIPIRSSSVVNKDDDGFFSVQTGYQLKPWQEWCQTVIGSSYRPEVGNARGVVYTFPNRRGKVTTEDISSFDLGFNCHLCNLNFDIDEDLYEHTNVEYKYARNCGYS